MSTPTRKLQRSSTVAANRALVTDANSKATTSSVTDTELGYLSGVTSAIQTQLDTKLQGQSYVLTAVTTDATETELLRSGSSQMVMPAHSTWQIQAMMTCRRLVLGGTWTARDSNRDWIAAASNSDGLKLVAAVYGGTLYTSTDSGATWTSRDSARDWSYVASSSDGVNLCACVSAGQIYTSADSGANWTARDSSRNWNGIASSSDGSKLVASVLSGNLYTSTDSGASWTARESSRDWTAVASSSDGSKLVAVGYNGEVYTSSNSGVSWTSRTASGANRLRAACCSSDGTKMAIAGGISGVESNIFTSTDSGATWTSRDSARAWAGIACSSDGSKLVASVEGGQLYVSSDYGVTWAAKDSSRQWNGCASNSAGTLFVAVAGANVGASSSPDKIYVSGATSEREGYEFKAVANRDHFASSVTIDADSYRGDPIGTVSNTFSLGADTATGAVTLKGTGAVGEEWDWRALVFVNQITTE